MRKLLLLYSYPLRYFALLLLILGGAQTALAHERVELGPYVVIVGWENEPVIVGERNAVTVEVSRDGQPITGLEGTLTLELLYAGRAYRGNMHPAGQPGHYRAEVFPTVRGQYTVHLQGQIEDLAVDERVDPEEVLPARVLQFPEPQAEVRDLQQRLDDVESRLQTAYAIALAGLIVGLLGMAVAIVGWRRR